MAKLSARLAAHAITQRGHPALIGSVGRAWVGEEVAPIWERWGPVDGVILAAGAGSRFGGVKQVATVNGVPLVVRAARTALDSHVRHVWVITGAHVGGVDGVLAPLIEQAGGRLRVVHNPAWAAGQSTSMHLALDSLHPGGGGHFPARGPALCAIQPAQPADPGLAQRGGDRRAPGG